MVIPAHILANAKGLVVLTVLKAGFLFSGRAGSGVIVARLPDGSWSGPSAVVTAGAGVGGQIGAELTDFVFILNTKSAVDSFAQAGSITLGGNVSLAAGPLGRNAEAAGSASLKSVAAIFSYSKTKGLFAGISLEGSVLVERREANRKFYGNNCTAKSILAGRVEPPPECDTLFRVLESRVFRGVRASDFDDDYYDDIPDYLSDDESSSGGYTPRRRGSRRETNDDDDDVYGDRRRGGGSSGSGGRDHGRDLDRDSTSSWQDDVYDQPSRSSPRRYVENDDDGLYDRDRDRDRDRNSNNSNRKDRGVDDVTKRMARSNFKSTYSDHPPGRPTAAKPKSSSSRKYDDDDDDYDDDYKKGSSKHRHESPSQRISTKPPPPRTSDEKAVALFSFDGEQDGDLSFRKGDVINIVKRSESKDDWWTGSTATKQGIFPANYVDII